MTTFLTPGRTAAGGVAVLMACACGAGASSAKLLTMSGLAMTSKLPHSLLLGIGALAVTYGLARVHRLAAGIAAAAFVLLAAAAALTPPMMMSAARLPWNATGVAGGVLYLLFGAALAYAFWLAFPPRQRGAAATALAGTAVASGCSCCMITGAIAGLAVTAGGSKAIFLTMPTVFVTGLALAAVGLVRMGGIRTLPWLLAGGLLTRFGGRGLQLIGDWNVGEVNLRFIPGYLVYLLGAALVMKAWAVAYQSAEAHVEAHAEGPAGEVLTSAR